MNTFYRGKDREKKTTLKKKVVFSSKEYSRSRFFSSKEYSRSRFWVFKKSFFL